MNAGKTCIENFSNRLRQHQPSDSCLIGVSCRCYVRNCMIRNSLWHGNKSEVVKLAAFKQRWGTFNKLQNRFNVAFCDTDQQNNVSSGVGAKTDVCKVFASEDTPESSPVQFVWEAAWWGEWRSPVWRGFRWLQDKWEKVDTRTFHRFSTGGKEGDTEFVITTWRQEEVFIFSWYTDLKHGSYSCC